MSDFRSSDTPSDDIDWRELFKQWVRLRQSSRAHPQSQSPRRLQSKSKKPSTSSPSQPFPPKVQLDILPPEIVYNIAEFTGDQKAFYDLSLKSSG